ncbi:hypothetical protein QQ045_013113 [Rhodiola kirilowii]
MPSLWTPLKTRTQRREIEGLQDVAVKSKWSTRAFRIMKDIPRGYDKVGATLTECKNFIRDLEAYTDGRDAHMIINNYPRKGTRTKGRSYGPFGPLEIVYDSETVIQ